MAALSYGIYEFSKSSQEYSYKANIICRIRDRIFLAVDESIVLISYGYGVTAFSNIRLILENIALAAYISKISEKEAETFLPFAEKQKADFHIKSKEWFKQLGGETGERKRIESLNEEKFTELYDEACAYIHASPYSLDEIPQKLRDNEFDKKALFPYGYEKTIIAFFDLCSYFMNFMVQHLVSDEKLQEQCIETNNMLVEALLLKIRK